MKSNAAPLLLNGPEAALALHKVQQTEDQHQAWPYRWAFAPPNSKGRTPSGSVVVPVIGATAEILSFTIPTNFNFILYELIVVNGPGFSVVPGDILYTVDVDTPTTGTPPLTASPLTDLYQVPFNRGTYQPWGPFKLPKAETITSGQTLRAKGKNVSAGAGAPNQLVAMFLGWLVPAAR